MLVDIRSGRCHKHKLPTFSQTSSTLDGLIRIVTRSQLSPIHSPNEPDTNRSGHSRGPINKCRCPPVPEHEAAKKWMQCAQMGMGSALSLHQAAQPCIIKNLSANCVQFATVIPICWWKFLVIFSLSPSFAQEAGNSLTSAVLPPPQRFPQRSSTVCRGSSRAWKWPVPSEKKNHKRWYLASSDAFERIIQHSFMYSECAAFEQRANNSITHFCCERSKTQITKATTQPMLTCPTTFPAQNHRGFHCGTTSIT